MAAGDVTADRAEASDMYGAYFDGVDDYVDIAHDASQLGINLLNGFTISAWLNPIGLGETDYGRILSKENAGADGNGGFYLAMNGATSIRFKINAGTSATSAALSVPLNKWTHVLLTVTSAQLANIYINGALSGAANQNLVQTISTIISTDDLRIGNISTGTDRTTKGFIKDVKMWSRVLTSGEIALDYARTNIPDHQLLNVPLIDDYNDKSLYALTGTNSGTILTKTKFNAVGRDVGSLKLAAAKDKIVALPIPGRDGQFTIIGANTAAA